jgi:hypothetical protein
MIEIKEAAKREFKMSFLEGKKTLKIRRNSKNKTILNVREVYACEASAVF